MKRSKQFKPVPEGPDEAVQPVSGVSFTDAATWRHHGAEVQG